MNNCNDFYKRKQMTTNINLDLNKQIIQRKAKLNALRQRGQAYPNDFCRKHLAEVILNTHQKKNNTQLKIENIEVCIAGRIIMQRLMGKASFVHIQDKSGRIQLYLRENNLAKGVYTAFKSWDIGDIIGAKGVVFKTKTGELSIKVKELRLLTKSLRPLPDKWHGLHKQEIRYRQRYLDLIVNESSREIFKTRTKIIQLIRDFMNKRDFLEVETPMMQVMPGGATARPFITHHNALNMNLYLRISPELYLKKLIIGGFERVYEINRNFRNEGISTKHNPEFTMLEFYQAFANYRNFMNLTEEILQYTASTLTGDTTIINGGETYELSVPFTRMTVKESLLFYNSDLIDDILNNKEKLITFLLKKNLKVQKNWGLGKLQFELFEHTVESHLQQPIFITQYPAEVSPLARCNDADPFVTDRFELFIGGREIANGFSELNDPEEQAKRFKKQVAEKEAGNKEAMHYDADYIKALEYGMPPTAGEGIGIDRLVMLFTNSSSIRDVLLFPHMRSTKN